MFRGAGFLATIFFVTSLHAFVVSEPRPVSPELRIVPESRTVWQPVAQTSGDRALVLFDGGASAVRVDEDGLPFDVPALRLPQPQDAQGVDIAADERGWTVGWLRAAIESGTSSIRTVRISRDGVVGAPRDIGLPAATEPYRALRLAQREVLLAAVGVGTHTSLYSLSESGVTLTGDVVGVPRDLVATQTGFALLLDGGVVRLTPAGAPRDTVALPDGFRPVTVVSGADALFVAGHTGETPTVLRISTESEVAVLAQLPGHGGYLDIAVDDGEVVVVLKRTRTLPGPMDPGGDYDLFVNRIGSQGATQRLVQIRTSVDYDSQWVGPADAPAVTVVDGHPIVFWTEGVRGPSGSDSRNLYSAVLDEQSNATQPQLLSWRIADQVLIGTAASDHVILIAWREAGRVFAKRFNGEGVPLDPQPLDLGTLLPVDVHSAGIGFLIRGENGHAYVPDEGAPIIVEGGLVPDALSCTTELCLAAWIDPTAPGSIRMSRWNDGLLLDAPGILVAASDPGYTWMAMQNDGSTFVAILARPASAAGGTIIDAAHIAHVDGEWRMRVSPFVATTEHAVAVRLLREGDHYLAHWSEVEEGVFASRLSFDGHSLDGDDTSWRGWPIADVDSRQPFTFDGTRTWFIGNDDAGARVYQLSGRTATPLLPLSAGTTTSIACVPTGGCVLASAPAVVYYPPFPKDPARVTLQVIRPGRRRSVGR